jgi:hypothetical protein
MADGQSVSQYIPNGSGGWLRGSHDARRPITISIGGRHVHMGTHLDTKLFKIVPSLKLPPRLHTTFNI